MNKIGFLMLTALVFTGTLVSEVGAFNSQSALLAKETLSAVIEESSTNSTIKLEVPAKKADGLMGAVADYYKYWYTVK